MPSELRLPTKLDPLGHRALPALIGARQDQVTLKFCQPARDRDHEFAVWRGRIGRRIAKGFEAGTTLADRRERIEQVPSASRQAI
jgi:hypothetical protein